ncbi:MAG: tetratricopeptide repeat protein [Betaproteobacteria bacterium]|nr:tetratricopeptide repeat protein [Betaproteobacteria bacterium]
MIFHIPLRDLKLFSAGGLEGLTEAELVARLRAEHPRLLADAQIEIAGGMVTIRFPEPPAQGKAEAARLLEKGIQRCRQGEYRKAAGILERVLELDPSSTPAYRNLGMALMELGETEQARQHLVEAALLDPKDAWPYVVLGNALVREPGKLDAAEGLLAKAHELDPKDPWAMNSLGGIAMERGDLAAAVAWFSKALAAKPDFANAHYGWALALSTQGRDEAALERLGLLFAKAEVQDARSRPVFANARSLWREITARRATAHATESIAAVRAYLDGIAERSGFPVREEWADFPENYAAQTQMAWKKGRDHHLVRLRRGYPEPAWHHILAHEATHISMEAEARALGRNRWFTLTDETRRKALRQMEPEIRRIARQGHSAERLAALVSKLLEGAAGLLFNTPIDMAIESRLARELPVLREAQLLSLDTLAREAAALSTHREIRQITPERILAVNDTLNAAAALFLRDLSGGALDYIEAYRPFNCLARAERLYAAYRDAEAEGIAPGQEYDLVDEFASQLGVRAWYVWQADSGPGGAAASEPPAQSRKIESPAALMCLVAALERLDGRGDQDVAQIAAEAALKGTTGLDLDSPEKLHSLSAFGNERFSGLELLCLMHAAMQRVSPGTDVGADFSGVWTAAQMIYATRKK